MAAYAWKIPALINVSAEVAGAELERICEKHDGNLEPAAIVDESRPETAPLHGCFEWNDTEAAEKWREQQARGILGNLTITVETRESEPIETRAFVHVEKGYTPIKTVLRVPIMYSKLMTSALAELHAFEMKYAQLQELAPVFAVIHEVQREAKGA